AFKAGKIDILFNARVIEILPEGVKLAVDGKAREIKCDHIFALIGARPDVTLLAQAGVAIAADGRPEYDLQTHETAIANLFVAGHLTREMHMKNAIAIPPRIVALIAHRLHSNDSNSAASTPSN